MSFPFEDKTLRATTDWRPLENDPSFSGAKCTVAPLIEFWLVAPQVSTESPWFYVLSSSFSWFFLLLLFFRGGLPVEGKIMVISDYSHFVATSFGEMFNEIADAACHYHNLNIVQITEHYNLSAFPEDHFGRVKIDQGSIIDSDHSQILLLLLLLHHHQQTHWGALKVEPDNQFNLSYYGKSPFLQQFLSWLHSMWVKVRDRGSYDHVKVTLSATIQ